MESDSLSFLLEPQLEEPAWGSHEQIGIAHSYPPATCWAAGARAWPNSRGGQAQAVALAGQALTLMPGSSALQAGPPQSEALLTPATSAEFPFAQAVNDHPPAPVWQQAGPQPSAQQPQQAAPPSNAGKSRDTADRRRGGSQPGGMSRQQLRSLQRQQRVADQNRIKGLEQQLGALRRQLETLSIENQHLKQRQAALNATLDMQQQLQAAAAAGGGSLGGGSAGQPSASDAGESAELRSLGPASSSIGPSHGQEDEGSELDESAVDSLLAELAASAAEDTSWARAAELVPPAALGGTPWQAAAGGASAGCWFFSASLAQHVQWYRCQVQRLQQLLGVLDGIPPRLRRSLEDYKLHEETMDLVQGVLADIDDWTIRMAALRPDCFGAVLHNNLEELLEGGSHASPHGGAGATGGSANARAGAGAEGGAAAADAGVDWQGSDSAIWQELVEALALTPQQERTLEAHQALFEQQAAAVEEGKAAVLAALADAAKQDDPEAALQLLQGAAALRVSLQQDMLAKAPTMISLRKVLTPLQMARLIVNCWPFYSTMKNVSRAHKQRRLASGAWRR
ncbi:hypothetical protein ABPG77_005856 [Micractinium sp. CCAP 211/92]